MNPDSNDYQSKSRLAFILAVLGAFFIVAILVLAMRHYTQPPPLNTNRATERANALEEIRNAERSALDSVGYVDPTKDLVRLPVEVSASIVLQKWRDPAVVRSNLIVRVEKAYPPPPPPPPNPLE